MKKLMLMAVVLGLTLGLAGVSYAATISCGQCHGAGSDPLPTDADNCNNTARGLHGVHANYSSAAYPKTVASYGKCAYCHTATATKAPSATHNNNYVNVTSSTQAPGLDYNGGTSTCTSSCHKNNAATAVWGSYTAVVSANIKLSCSSCHDDVAESGSLSGNHGAHLGTGISTGGTAMGAANNAGCVNCHPENTADQWSGGIADDGSKKAYPHASDGTNVVADNATVTRGGMTFNDGPNTCANSCHPRSTPAWGGAMSCDMCHYQEAVPSGANNTGTGSLTGAHSTHFDAGKVCSDCHGTDPVDASHATALPAVADNAAITRTGMTFNDGANTCTFGGSGAGVGCHGDGSTAPDWNSNPDKCATCHNYPGSTSDWVAGNGHNVKYASGAAVNTHLRDNGSYAPNLDSYSSVVNDVSLCGRCHNGLKTNHNNGSINVAGNGAGQCGSNFTPTITETRVTVTCGNAKCHNGKTTPNWW